MLRVQSNIPKVRNICIENMEGEYIIFWNADTIAPKDAIKVTLETLNKSNALAAICIKYQLVEPRNMKSYGQMVRDDFVAFKRDAFNLVASFNELFYGGEYEILRRLEERVKNAVVTLPLTCIHFTPKMKFRERVKRYFSELRRYFCDYSMIYVLSFRRLPLTYKLRLPYYLLLSWVIVMALFMPTLPASSILIAYMLLAPLINYTLRVKMRAFPTNVPATSKLVIIQQVSSKGLIAHLIAVHIVYGIPRDISFTYGVIFKILRRLFGYRNELKR